uniref:uncharacterized protein LOC143312765 n=1 Tax=Arvicanthis niloticus TaxID=61156 RepID=UPI00402BB5F4
MVWSGLFSTELRYFLQWCRDSDTKTRGFAVLRVLPKPLDAEARDLCHVACLYYCRHHHFCTAWTPSLLSAITNRVSVNFHRCCLAGTSRTTPEKQPPDAPSLVTYTAASTGPVPSDLSSDGSIDPGQQETANSPKTGQTSPYPFFCVSPRDTSPPMPAGSSQISRCPYSCFTVTSF